MEAWKHSQTSPPHAANGNGHGAANGAATAHAARRELERQISELALLSEHVRRALRADGLGVMLSLTVLSMYPTLTRSELRVAGRFGRSGQAGLPP